MTDQPPADRRRTDRRPGDRPPPGDDRPRPDRPAGDDRPRPDRPGGVGDDDLGDLLPTGPALARLRARLAERFGGARLARPTTPRLSPVLDIPIGDLPTHLLGEVPLALLPIRLETRFGEGFNGDPVLRIRVFPDDVHIDDGLDRPTASEWQVAQAFWRRRRATRNPERHRAAWRQFVAQVGRHRAGPLARLARPTTTADGEPTWPDVELAETERAGVARALPDNFLAVGWRDGKELFRHPGRPLDHKPYHTSPDPKDRQAVTSAAGLRVTEPMRWMFDYQVAEARGMAITVPLPDDDQRVDILVVVGLRDESPDESAALVADLLVGHATGRGCAFVAPGTPTNNTDTVDAGWTADAEIDARPGEVNAELDRELGALPAAHPDDQARLLAHALGVADDTTLRRLPGGTDRPVLAGRAMRRLLFETVIGRYLRELLVTGHGELDTSSQLDELRRHFVDHVTGGTFLPALRIGNQPYGVLPAMPYRSVGTTSVAIWISRIVDTLRDEWRAAVDERVPHLEHNAGELGGAPAGDIAAVLASEPWPATITCRGLRLWKEGMNWIDWPASAAMVWGPDGPLDGTYQPVPVSHGFVEDYEIAQEEFRVLAVENLRWLELEFWTPFLVPTVWYPDNLDEQLQLWSQAVAVLEQNLPTDTSWPVLGPLAVDGLPIARDVVAQLTAHEQRQRPLAQLDLPYFDGILGGDNPTLVVSKFDLGGRVVGRPLVEAELEPGSTDTADASLRVADYLGRAARGELTADELADAPLLAQLVQADADRIADAMSPSQRDRTVELLVDRPTAELDQVLRETLSLGTHRLDAWAASLVHERLVAVRVIRPTGVHLGAYGFVTDLRRSLEPPSKGFVHAPSLDHAATAAVIRAAWHARGDANPQSPAAVDLRSNRYRLATWLLDGMRAGQPLGDLLGLQFERLCHQLGIDVQIARMREVVASHHGRVDGVEQPVDGLELMELHRTGELADEVQATADEFGAAHAATLALLLAGLSWAFDAVDDALLAESTHHLLRGNSGRAAAVIEATSGADIAPPELVAMRQGPPTTSIEHRVVLLAPADAEPSKAWPPGTRDRVAPWLEALVETLVPAAAEVRFQAVDAAGTVTMHRLAELPLAALDAVMLGADDPTVVHPALQRLADVVLGTGVVEPAPTLASGEPTLEEFQVLAVELRRLLSSHGAVSSADLAADPPAEAPAPPTVDPRTFLEPWNALRPGVRLADTQRAELARLGIAESVDAAAIARLDDRRRAMLERGPDGLPALCAGLFGHSLPLGDAVTFDPELRPDPTLAGAEEVEDWIENVSVVRPDLARWQHCMVLAGLLGVEPAVSGASGQRPRLPGEGWAATSAPTPGSAGRRVLTALRVGAELAEGEAMRGLVLDRWTEALPAATQTTGVAVHFDAPSQRPPQSWLLGVPPEGETWSLDLAVETVLDTIEWMQLRAVAPEDLGDFGHDLPTVVTTPGTRVAATSEVAG